MSERGRRGSLQAWRGEGETFGEKEEKGRKKDADHVPPDGYPSRCVFSDSDLGLLDRWMVIWGTRPRDALPPGQYEEAVAVAGRRWKEAGQDSEHWSAGGSAWLLDAEADDEGEHWRDGSVSGGGATRRGVPTGPLGTDGDRWRGHFCRVCEAYVVRSDHHCPFLGTCVGAHNHAYFLGLVLHMALSMAYGSAVVLPSAMGCLSLHDPASNPKCALVLPIAFGIVFVASVLSAFWLLLIYLTALNLTIREALSLDVLRFRIGPCQVWRKIRQGTDVRANLANVLGGHGVRAFASLLIPAVRRPVVFRPLDLPNEGELAVQGVYWHVIQAPDAHGGVASVVSDV